MYICEAHASDTWPMKFAVEWPQPQCLEKRIEYAETCSMSLELKPHLDLFVDGMENTFNSAFCSWPTNYYVVSSDAVLLYIGDTDDNGLDYASYNIEHLFQVLRRISDSGSVGDSASPE